MPRREEVAAKTGPWEGPTGMFQPPPDPDLFDVEMIIDVEGRGRNAKYQVRFSGYPNPKDDRWFKRENLPNCDRLFQDFHKRRDAERHKRYYQTQHITKSEARRVLELCETRASRTKRAKSTIAQIKRLKGRGKAKDAISRSILKASRRELKELATVGHKLEELAGNEIRELALYKWRRHKESASTPNPEPVPMEPQVEPEPVPIEVQAETEEVREPTPDNITNVIQDIIFSL